MGPDASPIANVFSSRVITRELLSQGSSRLLEARRVVASAAFARSGEAQTQSERILQIQAVGTHLSQVAARKTASVPRPVPIALWADPDQNAAANQAWTFTYANGTFSIFGRRITAYPRDVGSAPVQHPSGQTLRLAA